LGNQGDKKPLLKSVPELGLTEPAHLASNHVLNAANSFGNFRRTLVLSNNAGDDAPG
jgi:hypothetical protein